MKVTIEQIQEHRDKSEYNSICALFLYVDEEGCKDWYYVKVDIDDLIRSMQMEGAKFLLIDDTDISTINWYLAQPEEEDENENKQPNPQD